MNNAHLSDKEIRSMIIEPETIDEDLQLHLKSCLDCQNRLDRIKEFTRAFQEQIEDTEINWTIEKGKTISTISGYRPPALWWRWGTVVIISCIILVSAFIVRQLYIPDNDIRIEETGLLEEIRILTEGRAEVELPQSILLLAEWEEEDFSQFLNFFSPIEEENYEKKDFINDSFSNNRGKQSLPT